MPRVSVRTTGRIPVLLAGMRVMVVDMVVAEAAAEASAEAPAAAGPSQVA